MKIQLSFVCLAALCFLITEQAAIEPVKCGPNQIYGCSYGCDSHCPEFPRHACDMLVECMMGCHCSPGFLIDRQRSGACVKSNECFPVTSIGDGPMAPNTRISAHGAPGQLGQAVGR